MSLWHKRAGVSNSSTSSGPAWLQIDEVLSSAGAEEEIEGRPGGSAVKMLGETGLEREAGYCSVIAGPEICLTTEEKSHLTYLFNKQVDACKDCMPVRLVGGWGIHLSKLP